MGIFKKKPLSKEELIARLEAIASEEIPVARNMGAMCYSRMSPPEQTCQCDRCNNTITYMTWKDNIPSIVKKIKRLGYDAKVEVLCSECCDKIKPELYPNLKDLQFEIKIGGKHTAEIFTYSRNFIFYFRIDETTDYHRVLLNNSYYYELLLNFLQGKSRYQGRYDQDVFLKENIPEIQYMTGIKLTKDSYTRIANNNRLCKKRKKHSQKKN